MAVVQNQALDSISAFTKNLDGTVTATVSYTYTYAPAYVIGGANTYVAGQRIYITGAETAANNGMWTVVSSTTTSIRYSNSSGVTQANQFALCSPVNVSMTKSLTSPLTLTAARPFTYPFVASGSWNPPPDYTSAYTPSATAGGNQPVTVTSSGTTHVTTSIQSPTNVSSARVQYPDHYIANLYPYAFRPKVTLPIVKGTLYDDGSNYLTFDGEGIQPDGMYSKCNIFTAYKTSAPTALVLDQVNGVLYVADGTIYAIRKIILSTGVESIIAGGATNSRDDITGLHTDGYGTGCTFGTLSGLALDQTNQILYATEGDTGAVRKIDLATLQVTTEREGSGSGGGIAFNPVAYVLYIGDLANLKIIARNLSTSIDTDILGGVSVSCMCLDSTYTMLYYCDLGTGVISVIDLGTLVATAVWSAGQVAGIAVDTVGGYLYASDGSSNINRITLSPFSVSVVAGSGTEGNADGIGSAASFRGPTGLALDTTTFKLYVADNGNNLIRKVSLFPGVATYEVTTLPGFPGTPGYAGFDLVFDETNNVLYCSGTVGGAIVKYDLATNTTTAVATGLGNYPVGIVLDSTKTYLYVAMTDGRILKVTISNGTATTLTGTSGSTIQRDTIGLQPYGALPTSKAWTVSACSLDGLRAVGGTGGIYVSTNSGASWTLGTGLPSTGTWSGLGIFTNGGAASLYATQYGGYVYRSTNSGATWAQDTVIKGGNPGNWGGVICLSAFTGSVNWRILDCGTGAENPIVYKTSNNGTTWTSSAEVQTPSSANSFSCDTQGLNIAVTSASDSSGFVAISTDYGNTFTLRTVVINIPIKLCAAGGSGSFLAAQAQSDGAGYIYWSGDSGNTWVQQPSAGYRIWTSIVHYMHFDESNQEVSTAVATSTTGVFIRSSTGVWTNITAADMAGVSFASSALWSDGTIGIFTTSAASATVYSLNISQTPLFNRPQYIARNQSDTCLYVTTYDANDQTSGTLREINISDSSVRTIAYRLGEAYGIAINSAGTYAYVSSWYAIVRIEIATGVITVVAGSWDPNGFPLISGNTDGTGTAARLFGPGVLYLDSIHNVLYFADPTNNNIRKIDLTTSVVTTLAGKAGPGASPAIELDGLGTDARFNQPQGITMNATSTMMYVSDRGTGTETLRQIDLAYKAIVTTDVVGTIPANSNAITISGTTYLYSSSPTIECIPGSDGASYTLAYNTIPGLTVPAILIPDVEYKVQLIVNYTGLTTTPSLQISYYAPSQIRGVNHPGSETPYIADAGTSAALVPFLSQTDTYFTISSDTGFTYVPSSSMTYKLNLFSSTNNVVFETYSNTITITRIPIIATPTFPSSFVTYTYVPISYTFSLPDDVVDVYMNATNYTTTNLLPYLSANGTNTAINFYSDTGSFTPLSGSLTVRAFINGVTESVGGFSSSVNILLSSLVANPSIPSGVPINLYKGETFSYSFTLTGIGTPLVLRYSRSSVQLSVYASLNGDSSVVTFAGTPPASYSSTFYLVIDLMSGTTVVNTLTYPVTISAARILATPAPPYALYQFENVSNTFGSVPTFSVDPSNVLTFDSLVSVPSLPLGVTFSNKKLYGRPIVQQPMRNYEIYGSNSTTGDILTTTLAISVGPAIVRISPSAITFPSLTRLSNPTATFTALLPDTPYAPSFQYVWSNLPDGLFFKDINNTPLSMVYSFSPTDDNNTIKLDGTPTLTDIATFPSSNVTVTLSGYYKDAGVPQTVGVSTLTLNFAEAVGMTGTVSSQLFVGKPLGTNDVVLTAQSYFFTSGGGISSFVASALPAGLGITSNSSVYPTRWWLTGTPTTASAATNYTFTATNSNAVFSSNVLSIAVNPDIVSFSQTIINPTPFIVSLPLATNTYRVFATATSGTSITYTSSVDLTLYGLSLNSSTGYVTGTPTSNFGPASVVFTATDSIGAFASYTNTAFTIANDVFTWPTYAPTFFQNQAMTPYQIVVTTASGRTIQSFTSTNMPAGLTLNPSGLISGTLTGTTSGTFTVTATTGYQAPPTASKVYSYTVVADNLLIVQTNDIDPVSTTFSATFTTIQYSTNTIVTPTYSATIYPIQYPAPVLTITQSGLLSGNFTGVPAPYPLYNANITTTYGAASGTTTAVISLSNTPKPFILAGYSIFSGLYRPQIRATPSYVFNSTASGGSNTVSQVWSGALPFSTAPSTSYSYPDFAMIGTSFVAVTPSNVYDGVYNSATNSVTWTENTPVEGGRFGSVANDGATKWVIVKTSSPLVAFTRTGNTGVWTAYTDTNSHSAYNPGTSTTSTLSYINGTYLFGQNTASGSFCNILYSTDGLTWNHSTIPSPLSQVYRFGTSNTTIVAVGKNVNNAYGSLSYSTDSGVTWTTPTLPSWMTGSYTTLNDILYANNTWVTCGLNSTSSNLIAYSPDLSNWSVYSNTGTTRWTAISFNGNAWTIAGYYMDPANNPRSRILSLDAGAWPTQVTSIADGTLFAQTNAPSASAAISRIITTTYPSTSSAIGTITTPSPLSFAQPTQIRYPLYQYVPYTIPIQATGASGFIYYYALGVPVGFKFVLDPTGTTATITGISPSNGTASITLYAKTATSGSVRRQIAFSTTIPYFVNPQSGAAAYTAIIRDQVDANAAQNARDKTTFPQVDSLAGPFMAPRAPDVITQSNCFLGLCKKPCPTCRTTL